MNNTTKFESILWSQYSNLLENTNDDRQTLYFISDRGLFYTNGKLYSGKTELITVNPDYPELNTLYVNKNDLSTKIWNGLSYDVVSKGYTAHIDESSTDDLLPTGKAVVAAINSAISAFTNDCDANYIVSISDAGEGSFDVTQGENTETVTLNGVALEPEWEPSTSTLTIPVAGKSDLVINFARDLVVKAGKYNTATREIWLSIAEDGNYDDEESLIKIPVDSLVDIYTGKETNTTTTNVLNNEISVDVKISSKSGNALSVDVENGGLYVNVPDDTNKLDKVGTGHAGELVIAGADGTVGVSGAKIGGEELSAVVNAETLATEAAVKASVDGMGTSVLSAANTQAQSYANSALNDAKTYADDIVQWVNF